MDPAAETPFRVTTAVLLVAAFLVRLWFQRRVRGQQRLSAAHVQRERRFYNIVLAAYLLAFVYSFSRALDRFHLPLDPRLRWAGAMAMAAATALLWWTHHTLGRNWSGILEIYRDHSLVITGPYRLVRHPMYLGLFVFGIGLALLSANWLVAATYLGSVTWMYIVRVPSEEQLMVEHFGETYRRYMSRTGRLMPRFWT